MSEYSRPIRGIHRTRRSARGVSTSRSLTEELHDRPFHGLRAAQQATETDHERSAAERQREDHRTARYAAVQRVHGRARILLAHDRSGAVGPCRCRCSTTNDLHVSVVAPCRAPRGAGVPGPPACRSRQMTVVTHPRASAAGDRPRRRRGRCWAACCGIRMTRAAADADRPHEDRVLVRRGRVDRTGARRRRGARSRRAAEAARSVAQREALSTCASRRRVASGDMDAAHALWTRGCRSRRQMSTSATLPAQFIGCVDLAYRALQDRHRVRGRPPPH